MAQAQPLKVAVTGGSGKVGRATVAALQEAGHRVVNFDVVRSSDDVRTVIADFADYGQALGCLAGVDVAGGRYDAVVHLAGIPTPGAAPDAVIFNLNTISTYNVFHASRALGIKRIVWASSETLLGLPFTAPPPFAPLDESIRSPGFSYALTKELGEVMAETFVRWEPEMSISSMRFSNVYGPGDYAQVPEIQADPRLRKVNLWAYVDARDCGAACRLALEAGRPGHEAYIIAAADTIMQTPSAELMRNHFPDTPLREGLTGHASLISSDKARRLLGYEPRHSWRNVNQEG